MQRTSICITSILMGICVGAFVHLFFQHQGAEWKADMEADGQVQVNRLHAYGYDGPIMNFGTPVSVNEDGTMVPVTFSESLWRRLFIDWNSRAFVVIGAIILMATSTAAILLKLPTGKSLAVIAVFIEIACGIAIFVGGFAAKGLLGLDGIDARYVQTGMTGNVEFHDGLQISNIVLGVMIVVLALSTRASSLTRKPELKIEIVDPPS